MFGDMVYAFDDPFDQGARSSQVYLSYAVGHEPDVPHAICRRGAKGDGMAAKRHADAEGMALEVDKTSGHHPSDDVPIAVSDGREALREAPGAGGIPAGGCGQAQGLMRPLHVVDGAPAIKGPLGGAQIGEDLALEQLRAQGAMKPLVLTLGLRVIRSPMADPDAQVHEPDWPAPRKLVQE